MPLNPNDKPIEGKSKLNRDAPKFVPKNTPPSLLSASSEMPSAVAPIAPVVLPASVSAPVVSTPRPFKRILPQHFPDEIRLRISSFMSQENLFKFLKFEQSLIPFVWKDTVQRSEKKVMEALDEVIGPIVKQMMDFILYDADFKGHKALISLFDTMPSPQQFIKNLSQIKLMGATSAFQEIINSIKKFIEFETKSENRNGTFFFFPNQNPIFNIDKTKMLIAGMLNALITHDLMKYNLLYYIHKGGEDFEPPVDEQFKTYGDDFYVFQNGTTKFISNQHLFNLKTQYEFSTLYEKGSFLVTCFVVPKNIVQGKVLETTNFTKRVMGGYRNETKNELSIELSQAWRLMTYKMHTRVATPNPDSAFIAARPDKTNKIYFPHMDSITSFGLKKEARVESARAKENSLTNRKP